jgi:hypothetical protein
MLDKQPVEGEVTMTTTEKPAQKPVHKIRAGAIEVAIWQRESDKGPWFNVTMSRTYKQGEEWKQADTFGTDDLLLLAKLLDQAHSWIIAQPTKQKAA